MRFKNFIKKLFINIIFFSFIFPVQLSYALFLDDNYVAKWTGIEVLGTDEETAEKIRKNMPVKIGDTFLAGSSKKYCEACKKNIKEKVGIAESFCSIVWYGNEVAYLVIDIPEKNWKKIFRVIPNKKEKIAKLPKILNDLYTNWEDEMSSLMSSGYFPTENFDNGFKDFHDPALHQLALQLVNSVAEYNNILLDILHYSQDAKERQKAADLLAWSKNKSDLAYVLEWDLLVDPDNTVRNNIARSFLHSMSKIKDEKLLTNLIPMYCKQIEFPNHSDRNKALFSIKEILEAHPALTSSVDVKCQNKIKYIFNMSILENIKDSAKDILTMIEFNKNA